jgi:hypothetical protein
MTTTPKGPRCARCGRPATHEATNKSFKQHILLCAAHVEEHEEALKRFVVTLLTAPVESDTVVSTTSPKRKV